MRVRIRPVHTDAGWKVNVTWVSADAPRVWTVSAQCLTEHPWIGPESGGVTRPGTLEMAIDRVAAFGAVPLQSGDLASYGHLLFAAVLESIWNDIVADAAGQLVELGLQLSDINSEFPLQDVLWELLHDGTDFLVTHPTVDVAITRRIASSAPTPEQIQPPARILFVIGSDLSDPDVQAGAEFLGLMRELERSGLRIASSVIERASVARVTEAVARFKPDVVHFIAHGHITSEGVPTLLMRPDDDEISGPPQAVDTDVLYSCLTAGERLPSAVVLAACETGTVSAAHGMPIAQGLAARNVPVVIAMAGSVADQACRLFTRRFGAALAGGGSLLQAVADGRLAAYRRGDGPPSTTIDWALPLVFLADEVAHEYHPVAVVQGPTVSERIRQYDFEEGPVFCGRRSFLDLYDDLMSTGQLNVIAIHSAEGHGEDVRHGYGKTRLLREYGVRALLDGHVPVVIGLDDQTRPTSARRFAATMERAIRSTRKRFQLPPQPSPYLLQLLCGRRVELGVDWPTWKSRVYDLRSEISAGAPLNDRDALSDAVSADLTSLIADARAGDDPRIGPESRVLVLLDTVEQWGDNVDLLTPGILTQHGLGDDDEAVPVAMAFRSRAGLQQELFDQLIAFEAGKRWIRAAKLEPLTEGAEEGLAYRWIMLNANRDVAPPTSEQIYVVVKPDGQWRAHFGITTDRIPRMLTHRKFYATVQALVDQQELAPGDDNAALDFLLGGRI